MASLSPSTLKVHKKEKRSNRVAQRPLTLTLVHWSSGPSWSPLSAWPWFSVAFISVLISPYVALNWPHLGRGNERPQLGAEFP